MDPNGSQSYQGADNSHFQYNLDETQYQMGQMDSNGTSYPMDQMDNSNTLFPMDYGSQLQMNPDGSHLQFNANGTQVQMGANGFQVQMGTAHYQMRMGEVEDLRHAYNRLNRSYETLLRTHNELRQRAEADRTERKRLAEDNRFLRDELNATRLKQSGLPAQMAARNAPAQPSYHQAAVRQPYTTRYPQQQASDWQHQAQQQQQVLQQQQRQRQRFVYPPTPVSDYQGAVRTQQSLAPHAFIDLTSGDVPVGVTLAPQRSMGRPQPFRDPSSFTTASESSPPLPGVSSGEEASQTVTPNSEGSPDSGNNFEKRPAKRRRASPPEWMEPSRNRALNLAQNNLQGKIVEEAEFARKIERKNMEEQKERNARMEQKDREKKAKTQKAKEEKEAKAAQKQEERNRKAAERLARHEQIKAQRALDRETKAAEQKAADQQAAEKRAAEKQANKMAENRKHGDEDYAVATTTAAAPAPIPTPAPIPVALPVRRIMGLGDFADAEDEEGEELFGGEVVNEPEDLPEGGLPSQEEEQEEEYDEAGFIEAFDELEGKALQNSLTGEGQDEDVECEVDEQPQQQVQQAVQRQVEEAIQREVEQAVQFEVDEESEVSEEE